MLLRYGVIIKFFHYQVPAGTGETVGTGVSALPRKAWR